VRGSDTSQAQAQLGANTGNQPKDFKVKIVLNDPPPSLRPGLNASADITTATRTGVLAVPIQAVVVREIDEDGNVIESGAAGADSDSNSDSDDGPRKRGEERDGVFLVQDRTAIFTPVKTGIMGDTDIEILEGLTEGQEIVTGSYRTLRQLENDAKIKEQKKKKRERS
jgi:HlyD family secretion protein